MSYTDHTCGECGHWDEINGCQAGVDGAGAQDVACGFYNGPDDDDDDGFGDYGPDENDPAAEEQPDG